LPLLFFLFRRHIRDSAIFLDALSSRCKASRRPKVENPRSREIEAEKSGSQEAEKPGSGTTSSVAKTNETAYS
jgi:hypothetical protein